MSSAASIIYLGMDVHKGSITIAVLPMGAKSPTHVDRIPNDFAKLKRYLERLARQSELRSCYEASGAGYVLHRALRDWGYACDVIAPSLIPHRPGVQRKHDKRDACDLARRYRAGELTSIRIPTEAEERVRDVVRCRETFQREILKSRHYILKFLARRGFVYREGTNWCTPHLRWLEHLTSEQSPLAPTDRLVFREYHALLAYKLQRRNELDRQIEQFALLPALAPVVARLQCFRGIGLRAAMVLATEIGDWRRFERPGQLAAYLGLICREDSSGPRERKGSITKAGNGHCRHVLVQAAWCYHYRPPLSVEIRRRQQGQPPAVIAHAWKAQQRLHQRYDHLAYRKLPQIAGRGGGARARRLLVGGDAGCPDPRSLRGGRCLTICHRFLSRAPGARRLSMPEGVMRLAQAGREIPEPRLGQLPTNPILDRSGTPVLTGEYQQDSPSMLLQATRPQICSLTPAQSYQRPS